MLQYWHVARLQLGSEPLKHCDLVPTNIRLPKLTSRHRANETLRHYPYTDISPFLAYVPSTVTQFFTTSPSDKPQWDRQGQPLRRHEITGMLTSNIDVHCASMTLYWIALLQIRFSSTQNVIRKESITMSKCQAHFALLFENVPPVIVTNVGAPENATTPPDSPAMLCLNVPPSIVTDDTPLPLQYTFCGSTERGSRGWRFNGLFPAHLCSTVAYRLPPTPGEMLRKSASRDM